jgi:ribosomal protein S13
MRDLNDYIIKKQVPTWNFGIYIGPQLTLYSLFRKLFGFQDYYAKMFCFKYLLTRHCPVSYVFDDLSLEYKIRRSISKFVQREKIGVSVRNFQLAYIEHYLDNKSYRGRRHKMHLPTRGQRTRTNASKKNITFKKDINETFGLF